MSPLTPADRAYALNLAITAAVTGIIASLLYPAWSFLPLPGQAQRLFVMAFGPLLVAAFFGFSRFFRLHRPSVTADIAALFGMIAGVAFSMMIVVQLANTGYYRIFRDGTEDEALRESLQWMLRMIFSVQLGLDVVWDIFICSATVLLAIAMIGHPRFGMLFAVPGIILGAATLFLNFYTFPEPPADAGSVDLGPVVGLWFFLVSIRLAFSLTWLRKTFDARTEAA